jgi:alkylation response protein AidB-like acyl-CoA dehydrogenase
MKWDNATLFSDDNEADRAFRMEVRQWVEANCPRELCDRPTRIDPPELKPWHRKLYERGWIAPHWPREYGGMGATLTQQIILFEEIVRIGAPTHIRMDSISSGLSSLPQAPRNRKQSICRTS